MRRVPVSEPAPAYANNWNESKASREILKESPLLYAFPSTVTLPIWAANYPSVRPFSRLGSRGLGLSQIYSKCMAKLNFRLDFYPDSVPGITVTIAMSNPKRKVDWNKYKEKVSKKRAGRQSDEAQSEFITVQRLSSNVEGRCQKYSRIGPLTMVPMGQERSLDDIKQACKDHFNTELDCDVLDGERGPSYTDTSQIKNWKVIHIRFIEHELIHVSQSYQSRTTDAKSTPVISPKKAPPKNAATPTVAASVPLSQMLKLGRLIVPKIQIVTLCLEEFSVSKREWLAPLEVKLSVDKAPFASGAFRHAFMVTSIGGLPRGKFVLKRYKQDRIAEIEELFESIEAHTRKAVQLNALVRNFAQNMELERPILQFGQTFTYTKVYFSTLNGEAITLEEYIDGDTFEKYINNDGSICGNDIGEVSLKAEAFVHYTYERSNKQLMVLDIQGIKYHLCDPEIASSELTENDKSDDILFCSGNLSHVAIDRFLLEHKCNKYFTILHTSPFANYKCD
ncbi:hypothetical protein QZH41_005534 [Actinostola sp. cb2023]|nr:hypothetical protein QZH41_005534 [Actinostola sp. cb2023]